MTIVRDDSRPTAAIDEPVGLRGLPIKRPGVLAILVAAVFFAAIAPTLAWQEFSSGSENLLAQTVLEMRRGGPWLIPTLQEQARTQKPPLPAWITAAAVRPGTVAALADVDAARRDAAYARLAWQMRWPALLALCAMLPAVYGIGRIVGGSALGLLSVFVCGSTVLFLRHAHYATTDVQLALWVTVANLALMWALLEGRWWRGCATAGVALGLALMSKGPVALAQSILPIAAFAAWRAWSARRAAREAPPDGSPSAAVLDDGAPSPATPLAESSDAPDFSRADVDAAPRSRKALAASLGLALMLAVGLPWYAAVLRRHPTVGELWFREVTREGATAGGSSPWYQYAALLVFVMPWTIFFVAGLIGGTVALVARRGERIVLPLVLVIVPAMVMSLARDREERYLLPMIGPAAVVAAWGVWELHDACKRRERAARVAVAANWFLLGLIAIALPSAAVLPGKFLRTREGEPWFGWNVAGAALVIATIGVATCATLWYRGRPKLAVAATAALALTIHAVAFDGYARSTAGRSEMRPLADAIRDAHPDAVTAYRYSRRAPGDLAIYLNRTVPQVESFDAAATRAQLRGGTPVVFMFHKGGTPAPLAPPGWRALHAVGRGEDAVVAFVPEEVGGRE